MQRVHFQAWVNSLHGRAECLGDDGASEDSSSIGRMPKRLGASVQVLVNQLQRQRIFDKVV